MKAATVIAAVNAMRAVDSLEFHLHSNPADRARAMNNLCSAANAIEAELGAINIPIESATPPNGTSSPELAEVAEERK